MDNFLDSPADAGSPDPKLDLTRTRLSMRFPDHMNLVLFIVSTSEVDTLISLLQRFDLFVIENLEVGVLQDLEGVEPRLVVGLVLNGESGG